MRPALLAAFGYLIWKDQRSTRFRLGRSQRAWPCQLLVYGDVDGRLKIDVRLDGATDWLTQRCMPGTETDRP
ncbi:MAG: hypothetical protein ACREKH_16775, partial [Candidatus Rokuibacteriota bacterium]